MSEVLDATIPRRLLSGHQLHHWRARQRDRRLWLAEMAAAFGQARGRRLEAVVITRLMGPRERPYDLDNLAYGSCKQIVDALVRLGWAEDDKSLPVNYRQERAPNGRAGVRVELREVA
ncbi:MAG: hypothetical protein KatS3mg051_1526 [Anaerolineae bacterium]|nr:MAG: hypothetical protein KatS3mg051_1526 [Anaerolineae bacterium]